MFPHEIFFFSALFFIGGVFLKSIGFGFGLIPFVLGFTIVLVALGLWKKKKKFFIAAPFAALILFGAFYYTYDDIRFRQEGALPFGETVFISGKVDTNPKRALTSTEFVFKIADGSLRGRVLVRAESFRDFRYGDVVALSGKLEKPEESYARYLEKERVHGIIAFPKQIEKIGEGEGSSIKARLYGFKNRLENSFGGYFGPKSAAFLGGITLGSKAGFDKDFKEALQRSGTSHIVALSGYNLSVIAWVVMGALAFFMKRRFVVIISSIIILGFVVMTGAEASVVRAAILAFVAILAKEYGRAHDVRNAIIFAALIMVVVNPKVLVFDIGFQLSFLAFMGLVYLVPVFREILGWKDKGFLSWKENLLATFSAQIMVSPVLISQFGFVSLTSILTNLLVLWAIPYTMGLGFALAFLDLAAPILARALSFIIEPILRFEFFIIEAGARFSFPISPTLHWIMIVAYYAVVGFLVAHYANISRILRRA